MRFLYFNWRLVSVAYINLWTCPNHSNWLLPFVLIISLSTFIISRIHSFQTLPDLDMPTNPCQKFISTAFSLFPLLSTVFRGVVCSALIVATFQNGIMIHFRALFCTFGLLFLVCSLTFRENTTKRLNKMYVLFFRPDL